MSVYKPAKSRLWQYDFVLKGRRFHGSTGQETRRAAEAVERRYRLEAAEGRLDDAGGLTLDQAAGKWWTEVGRHLRDRTLEHRLLQLVQLMGADTRLNAIETRHVNAAVQKRRSQGYRRSAADDATVYPIAARTVNKDVVHLLRRIHSRARKSWGARGLHVIAWGDVELAAPPDPIVYYTAAQREAWLAECDPIARVMLQILLTYGLRKSELFFPLDAFDVDGPRLVLNNRKAGANTVPLKAADAADIAARLGRARAAGLDHVWFEEERDLRTDERLLVPVTYHGLTARLRSAARRAKIRVRAPIHGARHHAGTEALRKSKNLRTAGRLLGHADIRSTMRYAHALEDDVLAAIGETSQPAVHEETTMTSNKTWCAFVRPDNGPQALSIRDMADEAAARAYAMERGPHWAWGFYTERTDPPAQLMLTQTGSVANAARLSRNNPEPLQVEAAQTQARQGKASA